MNEASARQGPARNPITHFVLAPIFFLSFLLAIYLTIFHGSSNPVLYPWLIVLSAALFLLNMQARLYALRLQDRVIRLEERQRLTALLPAEGQAMLPALTTAQLIALRFASDAELPKLARRAVAENMLPSAIKDAVTQWRRDDARV